MTCLCAISSVDGISTLFEFHRTRATSAAHHATEHPAETGLCLTTGYQPGCFQNVAKKSLALKTRILPSAHGTDPWSLTNLHTSALCQTERFGGDSLALAENAVTDGGQTVLPSGEVQTRNHVRSRSYTSCHSSGKWLSIDGQAYSAEECHDHLQDVR